MNNIQLKILIYPTVTLGMLFFNFVVLVNLIIPDPCYYHINKTTFIFDLFYSSSSALGGHPEPNLFNLLFTLLLGIIIGHFIIKWLMRIQKTPLKSLQGGN